MEEALDLSFDRLLMVMMIMMIFLLALFDLHRYNVLENYCGTEQFTRGSKLT